MERRRPATGEVVVEVRGTGAGVGFSGVVVERGAGARLALGDEVFGTMPPGGPPPSFVVCCGSALARKPAGLAHTEAAVLAAVGPAALAAIRLSGVGPGDRVMVTGASDGAGAIAVQIAKVRGGRVTAVCGDRDVPSVWDLGADEVLARERDAGESGRFAAVIDTDRSVTPELAAQLLEPDGRLIAIDDGAVQATSDEIAPGELVALVERDRIFPARQRG